MQDVLNAFRHHRGRHVRLSIMSERLRMCSTPFGITEVGTGVGLDLGRPATDVLNAFRHHRGRHADAARGRTPPASAQRLSASQRSARVDSDLAA